jgi:hypothetical protein
VTHALHHHATLETSGRGAQRRHEMSARPTDEIRSTRLAGFIVLPFGLALAAYLVGARPELSAPKLGGVGALAALLLAGGIKLLVRPTVFVRFSAEGIAFPSWQASLIPWRDVLEVSIGPLQSPDGEGGTIVRWRAPLRLRLRGETPAMHTFKFKRLPRESDGTIQWLVDLETCPLRAEALATRCRHYLAPLGRAEIVKTASAAPREIEAASWGGRHGVGVSIALGGLFFAVIGGNVMWTHLGARAAGPARFGTEAALGTFVAGLGAAVAAWGLAVLRSRRKPREI